MENELKEFKKGCLSFRENYDCPEDLDSGQKEHLNLCQDCSQWRLEIDELSSMAMVAPQFDVSENLTQQILKGVEKVDLERSSKLNHVVTFCLLAFFAWLLFYQDSLESVWGLASWVIGFAIVAGFKYLLSDGSRTDSLQQTN